MLLGGLYATFKEPSTVSGRLENSEHWKNDLEDWRNDLEEASVVQTPSHVRQLFAIMLTACYIGQPHIFME